MQRTGSVKVYVKTFVFENGPLTETGLEIGKNVNFEVLEMSKSLYNVNKNKQEKDTDEPKLGEKIMKRNFFAFGLGKSFRAE